MMTPWTDMEMANTCWTMLKDGICLTPAWNMVWSGCLHIGHDLVPLCDSPEKKNDNYMSENL